MKTRTETVIDVGEWDKLVQDTYGRVYSFQQQDDCRDRGNFYLTVPKDIDESHLPDSIPEVVNHNIMGVKFAAWLARDPKQPLDGSGDRKEYYSDQWAIDLWWARNFYPDIQVVANELHSKGLLPAGEYTIDIDW